MASLAIAFVTTVTPFSWNDFSTNLTISFSNVGKICGEPSRIVTSAPRLAYAPPSSVPMTPPPTMTNFLGTSVKFNPPVESITRPPNLKPLISIGRLPVAMIAFLKVYVCAASSVKTRNVSPSLKNAFPRMISTLFFFSKYSTPEVNVLTTLLSFHSCVFEKSSFTFSVVMPKTEESKAS